MSGRGRRLSMPALGAIALAVTLVVVYFGFTKSVPFRHHWEIKAVFKTANNLKQGSFVRIAGVNVGKVTAVEHYRKGGDKALVTMEIDKQGRPLHKDAVFTIRPRIFLEGNFFVDVQPGTPSKPELEDGDTVPVNQTNTPVQLDQILTALQADTRDDLRILLREYSKGVSGAGALGFNRSLKYWKPAYRDSALVSDAALGRFEHDLSGYVDKAGVVAGALDRNGEQLKSLITDFHTTAAALAADDSALRAAIAELPRTLRAAQPALGSLNDSFPDLRALARDLRPGVRSSGPTIDASMPLLRQLRGLVSEAELRGLTADLRPTVPALTQLTRRSVDLYKEVRRAASCQNEVIIPWSKQTVPDKTFPARGPVYQEAPKPLPGLAGESRSGDANGSWFRVLAAGGTNLIKFGNGFNAVSALPLNGTNPPKPRQRPPLNADAPCETQETPDLDTAPGEPPPQSRVDTSNPLFKLRYDKARERAITWLQKQLELDDLDNVLKVSDKDATKGLLDRIAALKDSQTAALKKKIEGARG